MDIGRSLQEIRKFTRIDFRNVLGAISMKNCRKLERPSKQFITSGHLPQGLGFAASNTAIKITAVNGSITVENAKVYQLKILEII